MELWDVYDIDRQLTGKVTERVNGKALPQGEYRLVGHIGICNGMLFFNK